MKLQNSRCTGQMMVAHDIEGIFYAGTAELERFREESSCKKDRCSLGGEESSLWGNMRKWLTVGNSQASAGKHGCKIGIMN